MYLMRNHDIWIYVRCANSDPRIAFNRLYDLIDEAAGHGFLVRGTSFDHCSGNTLKDRIGLRTMLDAVEKSLRKIAESMTTRKTPYHEDTQKWNQNMVSRVLANEIYCGNEKYLPIITESSFLHRTEV